MQRDTRNGSNTIGLPPFFHTGTVMAGDVYGAVVRHYVQHSSLRSAAFGVSC